VSVLPVRTVPIAAVDVVAVMKVALATATFLRYHRSHDRVVCVPSESDDACACMRACVRACMRMGY